MPKSPILVPNPRNFRLTEGTYKIDSQGLIFISYEQPQASLFTALRLQAALEAFCQTSLGIYAGHVSNPENIVVTLRVERFSEIKSQGYHLEIAPKGIVIDAIDNAGLFYACCTLIQLLQYYSWPVGLGQELPPGTLPCLEIDDWPDFANRGVMLDISRDKVPTMETIFDLVDLLATWKINQLQLYTEHTFAYQRHREVWADASPFTGGEILRLDAYCRERFIELVPNQNSFGHLEHWLKLPRYKSLAEAPEGFDFPLGHHPNPFSLCPLDPGSLSLLQELYDELLPHFSSRQFNVGCDETFDLGQGRSKDECDRFGTGRVYLDFLLKIYQQVKQRGFRMQFWGDIIMDHPELVQELPKDSLALEWGYEADHPFDEHGDKFARAGLEFYLCPGTSSWNSIAGRTDNCLANLTNAAKNGLKHGAKGYLITDWGDNGHWQTLPVSYLGFISGAANAWCLDSNMNIDVREVLNRYAFQDSSGSLGKLAYDLGNLYHQVGIEQPNASLLFYVLQRPSTKWKGYLDQGTAIPTFQRILETIGQIKPNLALISSLRSDADLIQREFMLTIALLQHACMRGIFAYGSQEYSQEYLLRDLENIVAEYKQIWLMRNRPGGLNDSLSHFSESKKEYL